MGDLRAELEQALGATYRIERELGGGGMSRVFLATEVRLGRQVVIKVLPAELAQLLNPERFEREIQIAARLQHPHVVPLLAAGESDGLRYYVMPWVEGESLRVRLTREPQPPLADAVRILRDTADGLAHAHAHGIVHRDIKPENILLSGDHAVVTDFGVAKALADAAGGSSGLTSVGLVIGTPAYMAPEQAAADPDVGAGADVYALGVIGYEMLTGTALFEGGTPQALLAAHIARTPVPLAERRPDLPAPLTSLLDRCLAKAADARPKAVEIARELERLNTADGVAAPQRTDRPLVGRRPVAILGAALVVVVLGALGIRAWRARGAAPPTAPALAVMPFTPVTPDTALTRLGRELSLTLSNTLDGVGEFHTIEPLSVLAQLPEGSAPLPGPALFDLTHRLGATQALTGSLVHVGGDVRLDIALLDAAGGKPIARVSVTGPRDDIAALTDSAGWALVRNVWREGYTAPQRLDQLSTRSLPALRAYLRGEQLVVPGRLDSAASAYAEAIAADSGFLLAYAGYWYTKAWTEKPVEKAVTQRITQNIDRFPERDRIILRAYLMTNGLAEGDSLLSIAVQRWPASWPVWYARADYLIHADPFLGHSKAEALRAWQRTLELNPGLFWGWHHLWFAAFPYRLDEARRALAWLDSAAPERRNLRVWLRQEVDAWEPESVPPALLDSIQAELVVLPDPDPMPVKRAGPALEVNRRVAKLKPAWATELARGDALLWAARGRWDSALLASSRYANLEGAAAARRLDYAFAALAAWLGASHDSIAAARRRPLDQEFDKLRPYEQLEVLWFDGIRAAARHDSQGMDTARARLHEFLAMSQLGDSMHWAPDESLAAFALAMAGRPAEAGRRLAALEWAIADTVPFRFTGWGPTRWSIGIHRLAAARWLSAAGDTAQAVRLLRWTDNWTIGRQIRSASDLFAPISSLERAELLAGQGNEAEALLDLQTWLRQFDDPVLPLDALRARALRTRARLEGRQE
jgi:TolB-like protein